jgi:hypothetical protein
MALRDWSFKRVAVVALAWAVLAFLLTAGRSLGFMFAEDQKGGLAGVRIDVVTLGSWVLLPPLVLILAWRLLQRSRA